MWTEARKKTGLPAKHRQQQLKTAVHVPGKLKIERDMSHENHLTDLVIYCNYYKVSLI